MTKGQHGQRQATDQEDPAQDLVPSNTSSLRPASSAVATVPREQAARHTRFVEAGNVRVQSPPAAARDSRCRCGLRKLPTARGFVLAPARPRTRLPESVARRCAKRTTLHPGKRERHHQPEQQQAGKTYCAFTTAWKLPLGLSGNSSSRNRRTPARGEQVPMLHGSVTVVRFMNNASAATKTGDDGGKRRCPELRVDGRKISSAANRRGSCSSDARLSELEHGNRHSRQPRSRSAMMPPKQCRFSFWNTRRPAGRQPVRGTGPCR